MVERLAAAPGGLDEHLELGRHLLLVDEVAEPLGAQRAVEVLLAARQAGVGEPLLRAVLGGGRGGGLLGLLDPGVARDAHVLAPSVGGAPKRGADQLLGAVALGAVEQPLGLGQGVAQVHEPVAGEAALIARRSTACPAGMPSVSSPATFSRSSTISRSAVRLPTPGRGLEALRIPGGDRPQELSRRPAREDRDRHLRPDSRDRGEVEEEIALLLAREPVQRQRVVAGHQMGVQGRLLAARGHRLERLGGDRQAVADAARLDHHVVGTADQDLAAHRGDHPTRTSGFLVSSACAGRAWPAWQIATASASEAWSDSGGCDRPSSAPTMR